MNLYWIEIKRFLKKYWKILIIFIVGLGILFSAGLVSLNAPSEPEKTEDPVVTESTEVFGEDSVPAYFRFYMKQQDGTTYYNDSTVDEVFNLDETYELVLENTGINLAEIQENVQEQIQENTLEKSDAEENEEFQAVEVSVDNQSNIFRAVITTGDSESNMEVAEFYYDYLLNEGFDILDTNTIYSIEAPQLVELKKNINQENEEAGNNIESVEEEQMGIPIQSIIINVLIGFVSATIIAVIIVYLKEAFSKTLNFSFTYETGDPDNFMLVDSKIKDVDLIRQFIFLPTMKKKAIIMESELDNELEEILVNRFELDIDEKDELSFDEYQSLSEISLTNNIDEIIIIVNSNRTSRKWYNEQLEYNKVRKHPVKIIQFND